MTTPALLRHRAVALVATGAVLLPLAACGSSPDTGVSVSVGAAPQYDAVSLPGTIDEQVTSAVEQLPELARDALAVPPGAVDARCGEQREARASPAVRDDADRLAVRHDAEPVARLRRQWVPGGGVDREARAPLRRHVLAEVTSRA